MLRERKDQMEIEAPPDTKTCIEVSLATSGDLTGAQNCR